MRELRFDACDRSNRLPSMAAVRVDIIAKTGQACRYQPHAALDPARKRHGYFVDRNDERIAIPMQPTRTDRQRMFTPVQRRAAPFRHCPPPHAFAVECNINCNVALGVCNAPAARQGVVGRENATDERDDRQPVTPVVAQGVDVPPCITIAGHIQRKVRSISTARAAIRPDNAAIGTPGPGCTAPPARYNPGHRVRAAGRANDAVHPWDD